MDKRKQAVIFGIVALAVLGLVYVFQGRPGVFEPTAKPLANHQGKRVLTKKVSLPLNENSMASEVLSLMVKSHKMWNTLHITYTTPFYDPEPNSSESSKYEYSFWIDAVGKARVESGIVNQLPNAIWATDGNQISSTRPLEEDNQYVSSRLTEKIEPVGKFKLNLTRLNSKKYNTVNMHPWTQLLPGRFNDYIFSTGFAQSMIKIQLSGDSRQDVVIVGMETIAGRDTVIVERKVYDISNPTKFGRFHRFWVDAMTGVILKFEGYVPLDGSLGEVVEAIFVEYDQVIPAEQFLIAPGDA